MSEITFLAALAGTNTSARWLSVGGENDAKVVFEVPASEFPSVLRLATLKGTSFRVTITSE